MTAPAPAASVATEGRRPVVFPYVDGYRGIAALAIVVFHAAFLSGINFRHPVLGLFLARADAAVALFFVLSGFLLYRPFVEARLAGAPRPDTGRYAVSRVLRIVPAYWVVLTLDLLFVAGRTPSAKDLVVWFGFLQIYDNSRLGGGLSQAWTLCTEATFYVLVPLWAALQRRLRGGITAELTGVAVLYAVGQLTRAALAYGGPNNAADGRLDWLPATADLFALGMVLAVLHAWRAQGGTLPPGLAALAERTWLCWALAGGAYAVLSAVVFDQGDLGSPMSPFQVCARQTLYGLVAVLLILPGVLGAGPADRPRQLLESKALALAGLVSYGLYLVHVSVLQKLTEPGGWFTARHASFLPLLALTTLISLALAAAVHVLVERPALRAKEWLRRRPREAASARS